MSPGNGRQLLAEGKASEEGESCAAQVMVRGPEGVRWEPCLFRLKGLAVWRMAIPQGVERPENWPTEEIYSITHEHSGTRVAEAPTLRVLVVLPGLDWAKDMQTIKAAVKANRMLAAAIDCIKSGRVIEEGQGVTPTQKAGRA